MRKVLETSDLNVRYHENKVLRNISFHLDAGEILAVVGANGAGKTTLIKALNRSLPNGFDGRVSVGTANDNSLRDIAGLSRREIAARIAVVAQETESRFPITALEFVLAGRFINGGVFGWESESDIASAERALEMCDLCTHRDRSMNELSGGERQRVVLARALATNAGVLLLDEPTANLDIAHQAMMFKLVRERSHSYKAAAIVITHDLNLASEFADRILMLDRGQIAAIGAPKQVLTYENILRVFGVRVLLDSNPANGCVRVTNVY